MWGEITFPFPYLGIWPHTFICSVKHGLRLVFSPISGSSCPASLWCGVTVDGLLDRPGVHRLSKVISFSIHDDVTGEFPSQRPVMQSFDVFFDLCLNKCLIKQTWGWWFETPSRSLWWCHCNAEQLHACSLMMKMILMILISNRKDYVYGMS